METVLANVVGSRRLGRGMAEGKSVRTCEKRDAHSKTGALKSAPPYDPLRIDPRFARRRSGSPPYCAPA